jgi:hypothetical protein
VERPQLEALWQDVGRLGEFHIMIMIEYI